MANANYRQLWLTNSKPGSNPYYLTDPVLNPRCFFNEPEGFGFTREYETIQIGNSEKLLSQYFTQNDITGELVFYNGTNGDIYQAYQDFIEFAKFKPLYLHYLTPNNNDSYYSEVLFTESDKSEIDDEDGSLRVSVTFHKLTEWLTSNNVVITLSNDQEVEDYGKYYDLERPYHYSGTSLTEGTHLYNNGTDDVGFTVEIIGKVENPQFTLTEADQQKSYGVCKLINDPEDEDDYYTYVRINSSEKDEELYLEKDGVTISNPKQYQDLTVGDGDTYITFVKLKVGESIFKFNCSNVDTFDGQVVITYKNSYVTV